VRVSAEFEDILPAYLAERRHEASEMQRVLASGDLERARAFGLKLKATGTAFGLEELSRLGGILESAAKLGPVAVVRGIADRVEMYLVRIEVFFEPAERAP